MAEAAAQEHRQHNDPGDADTKRHQIIWREACLNADPRYQVKARPQHDDRQGADDADGEIAGVRPHEAENGQGELGGTSEPMPHRAAAR